MASKPNYLPSRFWILGIDGGGGAAVKQVLLLERLEQHTIPQYIAKSI